MYKSKSGKVFETKDAALEQDVIDNFEGWYNFNSIWSDGTLSFEDFCNWLRDNKSEVEALSEAL